MLRQILFMISLMLTAAIAGGQITVQVQAPPTGIIQKSQLWNVLLINTGNTTMNVTLRLSLASTKDNTPVMSGMSRVITVPKGAKSVSLRDVMPVNYQYYSPLVNDRNPDGFLPVGNFTACYVVNDASGATESEMAEDCLPVEIAPMAPPQLNLPDDGALVETTYPQFSWIPPAPLQVFGNLAYDLLLVEVMPGQTAADAIQKNVPRYNIVNEKSLANVYPSSYQPLDTSKEYAWRIVAKNNGVFAAQSEVWTFRIKTPEAASLKPVNGKYVLMAKDDAAAGINKIEGDILGVKYYLSDTDRKIRVTITSLDGTIRQEAELQMHYGENYVGIRLNRSIDRGKVFYVQITEADGNKIRSQFSIL